MARVQAWQQAYASYLGGSHQELLDEKLVLRREEGDWRRQGGKSGCRAPRPSCRPKRVGHSRERCHVCLGVGRRRQLYAAPRFLGRGRRWEEGGKWHWKESVRAKWAAEILAKHSHQRQQRDEYFRRLIEEQMRRAEAEARERSKRRAYGADFSSSFTATDDMRQAA